MSIIEFDPKSKREARNGIVPPLPFVPAAYVLARTHEERRNRWLRIWTLTTLKHCGTTFTRGVLVAALQYVDPECVVVSRSTLR